ncbi:MAG: anthranilate synthase component I [Chloroflexi bacterium]|nr:anthranilate synthase component I [Chloroflexota bacterium]
MATATPSLQDVIRLAALGEGNLVPIYRELPGDLETPVSVFLKVAQGPYSFLLESVEGADRWGRFSFIGTNPWKVLKTGGPGLPDGDPLLPLEAELAKHRAIHVPGIPRFTGGAVGYLAWECFRHFEPRVPLAKNDVLGVPESIFMFTDTMLVFDHLRHRISIVSHVNTDGDIEAAYNGAIEKINEMERRLREPLPPQVLATPYTAEGKMAGEVVSNMEREVYDGMVDKAREYIIAGDIIQVVLGQRFSRPVNVDPFTIYRALRTVNPSPYMFYVHLDTFDIVGASPEMLVRVEDDAIDYHPIAGTRRRGTTDEEDKALEIELRTDEKERAEHIMLVDLGRNDVGKVSTAGSVRVTQLMDVERYSHVMHLVSHVQGVKRPELSVYDVLRSCFPAGTVAGAPKIRAMEIVAELEPDQRGPYGGAVGYVSYSGNLDTAIALRTMVVKDGIAYVQAGGGIVYDSQPDPEYWETVNKSMALRRAIDEAEKMASE